MIVIFAALAGAIIGGLTAYRRKGNVLDILQYVTIYCIAFALVGLIATIIIHRFAMT
ncbi:apolipoprotein acyltransferase [Sagittula sp. SSi028]|uniref:apolipoprotein acyltransferase n=1 Tax=Sagittula sp. SSi028 TaxID=3400636 RepID=UPI003AF413F3